MKPTQKAFLFLVENQEWDMAGIFVRNMDTTGLSLLLVNAVKLINDMPIQNCKPDWLFDINSFSIFDYGYSVFCRLANALMSEEWSVLRL